MDNKKMTDKGDSSKIDINDPSEVEFVHQQFPALEHAQIVKAIRVKGPSKTAVVGYLETKYRKN